MSTFVNILCRSVQSNSLEELRDFIQGGCFFEEPPGVVPIHGDTQPSPDGWTCVEIHYQTGKRPAILSRISQHEKIEAQREEAVEELLQHCHPGQHSSLLQALREFRQVFVFEIDPVGATEECWMMVDALTAWLATSHDGVVFVAGEGFYDAALQPLCSVSQQILPEVEPS
jgi:hypothetical protein